MSSIKLVYCLYQESYRKNQWDVRNIYSIQKLFVKLELELLRDSEGHSAQWRQPEIFKRVVHKWWGRDPEYIRQFIRKRIKVSNWETNLRGYINKYDIVLINILFWTCWIENTQSGQANISELRQRFSTYFEGNFRFFLLIPFKVLIRNIFSVKTGGQV